MHIHLPAKLYPSLKWLPAIPLIALFAVMIALINIPIQHAQQVLLADSPLFVAPMGKAFLTGMGLLVSIALALQLLRSPQVRTYILRRICFYRFVREGDKHRVEGFIRKCDLNPIERHVLKHIPGHRLLLVTSGNEFFLEIMPGSSDFIELCKSMVEMEDIGHLKLTDREPYRLANDQVPTTSRPRPMIGDHHFAPGVQA